MYLLSISQQMILKMLRSLLGLNQNTKDIFVATAIDFDRKTVEMIDVVKKFGDFVANDRISLTVHKGEVHALLGENGAGKTTLMNCLYGLYRPTEGRIRINGETVAITDPNVAISR